MTTDEQISLFVQQAAWLEAENVREQRRRYVRLKVLHEIRTRNHQLTREFHKFMETHQR